MTRIDPNEFVHGLLPGLSLASGSRLPEAALTKLTSDTVAAARVAAGVHLAFTGTARALDLDLEIGPRTSVPAPTVPEAFVARCNSDAVITAVPEKSGALRVTLPARSHAEVVRVYLPEAVEVRIRSAEAVDGTIVRAPRGPLLVVYGDSISQGWSVSEPGLAWPSVVGDELGLEVVNLGFAGSARGELLAADAVGASAADVVVLAWGTNAWSSLPTDDREIAERMRLFLAVVRQGLARAPIIVVSPIVRPDAEQAENRFGTTHERLREALEAAVRTFVADTGDDRIVLVPGRDLVPSLQLADGIHPGDDGHASFARGVGPHVAAALGLTERLADAN